MKSMLRKAVVRATDQALFHLAIRAHKERSNWARKNLRTYAPDVADYLELRLKNGAHDHFFIQWKMLELIFLLEHIRPKTIVEFGSGITTYVFARYAAKYGAAVTTLDETPDWQRAVRDEMSERLRGLVKWEVRPSCDEVHECGQVLFYEQSYVPLLPHDIDLAYVDGPMCRTVDGRTTPCIDVPKLLIAGKVIQHVLFDYRIDSADYLLNSPVGLHYDGDLFYMLHRRRFGSALGATGRHHTHLRRREEPPHNGPKWISREPMPMAETVS